MERIRFLPSFVIQICTKFYLFQLHSELMTSLKDSKIQVDLPEFQSFTEVPKYYKLYQHDNLISEGAVKHEFPTIFEIKFENTVKDLTKSPVKLKLYNPNVLDINTFKGGVFSKVKLKSRLDNNVTNNNVQIFALDKRNLNYWPKLSHQQNLACMCALLSQSLS